MLKKLVPFLAAALIVTFDAGAEEPDWQTYAEVLKAVRPGSKNGVRLNLVDYAALGQSGRLEQTYREIAAFDPERLASREEKLAFYINAYNILALKMVLDHWPVESIKDAGSLLRSVWKKPVGEIGGRTVTLDQIEHDILRPMGEPRVHMAIVCASVSCPDLRDEPFTAVRLDAQLDEQARHFLNNSGKGLKVAEKRIRVSKIFDWFGEDFEHLGGTDAFIRRYRADLPRRPITPNIPYDWALNGTVPE